MPLAVCRCTELPGGSRTGQHKPGQIFSVNKECDESDECLESLGLDVVVLVLIKIQNATNGGASNLLSNKTKFDLRTHCEIVAT